jgi:hypothetical protein
MMALFSCAEKVDNIFAKQAFLLLGGSKEEAPPAAPTGSSSAAIIVLANFATKKMFGTFG